MMYTSLTVITAAAIAVAIAPGYVPHRSPPTTPTVPVASLVSFVSTPAALRPSRTVLAPTRSPVLVARDSTTVNQYMTYDAASKTVGISLVAAATSAQGGFNFNGGSSGDQTITVPAGWTVNIDFRNHDAIPHSAIVIKDQTPLPAIPQHPALARAYTSHLTDGLPAQTGHDTMQFTASPAGQYLIACGVPGHAASGMYIKIVVSVTAAAPSNTGTIGPP